MRIQALGFWLIMLLIGVEDVNSRKTNPNDCRFGYRIGSAIKQADTSGKLVNSELWDNYDINYMRQNPIPEVIYVETWISDRTYLYSGFTSRSPPIRFDQSIQLIYSLNSDCTHLVNHQSTREHFIFKGLNINDSLFQASADTNHIATNILSKPIYLMDLMRKYNISADAYQHNALNVVRVNTYLIRDMDTCVYQFNHPICASLPAEVVR
jgi:hypothetical protein